MKNLKLKLVLLLLLSPLTFFAQSLTGLWLGTLTNDSTSIRQDQSFEIALTQYKDKVYGYSRSTFIVNDTLYYIVKRVKGTIAGNTCEVEDDEIVSCNFKKKRDKGVKMVHTFRLNEEDSTWSLDGDWKTTKTKKFYSVSGKTDLSVEKDIDNSKIFPHLEELNLAKDIPFYTTARKAKDEAIANQLAAERKASASIKTEEQTGLNRSGTKIPSTAVKTNTIAVTNEVVTLDEKSHQTGIATEQQAALNKNVNKPSTTVRTNTVAVNNQVVTLDERAHQTGVSPEQQGLNKSTVNKPATAVRTNTVAVNNEVVTLDQRAQQTNVSTEQQAVNKPVANKPATAVRTNTVPVNNPIAIPPPAKQPNNAVANNKPATSPVTTTVTAQAEPEEKKPAIDNKELIAKNIVENPGGAASKLNERKTDAQQVVEFKSDSIVIAVFDNGEIDGDTVSVLLDGQVVLAKQGLKATASKKTLYLPADSQDDFTLVLYAENLGKYPPNTGLLVVYDGEDRHYVRFSADLQKNAGVVLRRKK